MPHVPHRASLREWERRTGVSARYLAREFAAGRLPAELIGRAIVADAGDVRRLVRELLERALADEVRP